MGRSQLLGRLFSLFTVHVCVCVLCVHVHVQVHISVYAHVHEHDVCVARGQPRILFLKSHLSYPDGVSLDLEFTY